ncbi:hypothetical protein [Moritella yayanosii]|uniref:Transposase n=1 Tax=Moritella yayanosii TaxID=69539 RepID=A0A330LKB5_9GAMM|nr:hypothetical protein [Moritella yayanosii]SQD77163.1 protein of unknown function, might belong to Transposase [Moritella yayanosii]
MKNIIRVGVDLAKNVFHIHAIDENEKTVVLLNPWNVTSKKTRSMQGLNDITAGVARFN